MVSRRLKITRNTTFLQNPLLDFLHVANRTKHKAQSTNDASVDPHSTSPTAADVLALSKARAKTIDPARLQFSPHQLHVFYFIDSNRLCDTAISQPFPSCLDVISAVTNYLFAPQGVTGPVTLQVNPIGAPQSKLVTASVAQWFNWGKLEPGCVEALSFSLTAFKIPWAPSLAHFRVGWQREGHHRSRKPSYLR